MTGSLGFGLLWFVVIIAAIPLALWLLKRSGYGAAMAGGANAPARTVASLAIGPQQRIVTVEVGTGDEKRWLVLGVTPQAIQTLHTLSPQAEPLAAVPAGPLTFQELFKKVRDARR
jgi:flagellar protein FliO/FliZ